MNIQEMESSTLSAINKLAGLEMPFAGAALCYVMIERCLKLYLLESRKSLTASNIDICAKVGINKIRFKDYASKDEASFVGEFLNTLQLGGLEIVYRIQSQGIADARNELVHSEFYISQQRDLSSDERQKQNWDHYKIAARHLSYSSKKCFKHPINFDETTRLLKFES